MLGGLRRVCARLVIRRGSWKLSSMRAVVLMGDCARSWSPQLLALSVALFELRFRSVRSLLIRREVKLPQVR